MPANVSPSILDPIDKSFNWTKRILFSEFGMEKWFVMGFCAFLAGLGGGGGSYGGNPFGGKARGGEILDKVVPWVQSHLGLIVILGTAGLAFGVALSALLQWLASRGHFMFMDGIVHDRAAVTEPWHRFRTLGNSLFVVRFVLGLIGLAGFLVVAGMCAVLAWPAIVSRSFGAGALAAIFLGACVLLPFGLVMALLQLLLKDFVATIMYVRNIPAMDAVRVFREEVLPGRVGAFFLFYLMKFVLVVASGVLIGIGTCITCCIAGLPYISSVVFLPVLVFLRAYALFFLEQMGDEWRLFQTPGAPLPPAPPPAHQGPPPLIETLPGTPAPVEAAPSEAGPMEARAISDPGAPSSEPPAPAEPTASAEPPQPIEP